MFRLWKSNRNGRHALAFEVEATGGVADSSIGGWFRTITQKATATTRPHKPYRSSTVRQLTPEGLPIQAEGPIPDRFTASQAVRSGATKPPRRPPSATMLLNRPRSSGFAHFLIRLAAAGYAPDSLTPSIRRII